MLVLCCINSVTAQYDRQWRTRKKDCERDACGHLVPDEAANCVNRCTSELCFAQVYGPEAGGDLEDGEVDSERERKFTTCLRQARYPWVHLIETSITEYPRVVVVVVICCSMLACALMRVFAGSSGQ